MQWREEEERAAEEGAGGNGRLKRETGNFSSKFFLQDGAKDTGGAFDSAALGPMQVASE